VRVLLREPGGRVSVEVGTAELLEEGPELRWHGDIGDTVDLLDIAVYRVKVIGLTRLGADTEVACNIDEETH